MKLVDPFSAHNSAQKNFTKCCLQIKHCAGFCCRCQFIITAFKVCACAYVQIVTLSLSPFAFSPFFLFVGIHWASFVNGLKVLSSLLKLGVKIVYEVKIDDVNVVQGTWFHTGGYGGDEVRGP